MTSSSHANSELENLPAIPVSYERRENNFDFLRLVLATLVLLAHAPEIVDGDARRELLTRAFHAFSFGELAVYGFFLLSGFLIVASWLRQPNLPRFVEKRAFRICPGFVAASLVCIFVVGPLATNAAAYFENLHISMLLLSMFSLTAPRLPPVFAGTHYPAVNGAMWTISCEFRCYMIVAAFGFLGLLKKRWIWLAFGVVDVLLYIWTCLHPIEVPKAYFLFGCEIKTFSCLLMFFFSGGAFCLYREYLSFKPAYMFIAAVIFIGGMFNTLSAPLVTATFGAYVLFYMAFAKSSFVDRIRPREDISYGVYLYGWPVQKLLLWWFPGLSPWLLFLLSVGGSFLCGWLSWRLVEGPFLRLKRKLA